MHIFGVGIAEILVLSGLTCLAGEVVLIGAAVVAAIVFWRKESKWAVHK
jgi:hypothetical protein